MARRRLAALSAGILALVVALMGAATAPPAAAIVGGAVAPPGATPSILAIVDPQLHFQFCGGRGDDPGLGHDRPRGHDGQHPAPHRDGPVLSDAQCSATISTFRPSDQICAGTAAIGPCTGDSGGPLYVVDTKGTTRVAGVVSYGSDPCNLFSGGFVQVSANLAWIQSVISAPPP